MTGANVQSQVDLILTQASGQIPIRIEDGTTVLSLAPDSDKPLDVRNLVRHPGSGAEAKSEHLDLLRMLYSAIPDDLRPDFWEGVKKGLIREAGAQVVAHLIVELHDLDQLPSVADLRTHMVVAWFWNGLRTKLTFQAAMFADADLDKIAHHAAASWAQMRTYSTSPIVRSTTNEISSTLATISRIRYLRLKDQLLSTENPELNTDRKELVSRVQILGFSTNVSSALEEVERKIRAATTELDFRGCMDLLRVIFEEIFEESCRLIETKVGTPAPPKTGSNFQPFKQYLENSGLLSSHEAEVTQKLYNYLSMAGSHTLSTAPEQLRVSKNTVIEWSLMTVGRVQAFV